MRKSALIVFGLFYAAIAPRFVLAAEIEQCGAPLSGGMETDVKAPYCDIHARQAAYPEARRQLHDDLVKRQHNFVAPQLEAISRAAAGSPESEPAPPKDVPVEKITLREPPAADQAKIVPPQPPPQPPGLKNLLPDSVLNKKPAPAP